MLKEIELMDKNALNPREEYQKRSDQYSKLADNINKRILLVSNLRLLIFLVVISGAIIFYRAADHLLLGIDLAVGIAVFVGVVLWHNSLHYSYNTLKKKIEINKSGLMRMDGQWSGFKDCGEDFIDHEHPYSWDLDIFGPNSLFQLISVCHTFFGRKALAQKLCEGEKSVEKILKKQEAINELARSLDWRQDLELHGMLSDTGTYPQKFLLWSTQHDPTFKSNVAIVIFRILPWFSFLTGIAGFILYKTLVFFAIAYVLQFVLYAFYHAKVLRAINAFEKNGPLLLAYSRLLHTIESEEFKSDYLNELKQNFRSDEKSASEVFRSLSKILNAAEVRYSPMAHLFANAIMLWDFQCIISADRLKKNYGKHFGVWIETIAKFEALSSLSIIRFENPLWVFPSFTEEGVVLKGEGLGHPLLHSGLRVSNDLPFQPGGTVAIITGSNMSGKSTFLRTVGTNLVMAMAGAPVCASSLHCTLMQMYTSMRINDDLSSKVSTFYAELLRIRKMVEAVRRDEKLIFLLDELFRGTNSQDRHDGAVAVLKALSNHKSIGIISTHDLQLCNLAYIDQKRFVNYHFKEQYSGDSITFDYKLNPGESKTKNAMFLIKMMGI